MDETLKENPESMLFPSASLALYLLAFVNVVMVGKKAGSNLGRGKKLKKSTEN